MNFRVTSSALVLLLCSLASLAKATPTNQDDDYKITVEVLPNESRMEGVVEIQWSNRSSTAVDELFFHLYLNAFSSSDSRLMQESGGRLRGRALRLGGSTELGNLMINGEEISLSTLQVELIPGDRTQLRVPLDSPCSPNQRLRIRIEFTSQLPSVTLRSGIADGFILAAQFFPKLARLEPNGTWATFPYHALGEFYADFARYELLIKVPHTYDIAGPGEELAPSPDAPEHRRFVLNHVHDIAFSTWDRFQLAESSYEDIAIRVFHPDGYAGLAHRQAELIEEALAYFQGHFGPYPHPSLVVVIPPREARGAAGMEYPALITTDGPRWPTPITSLPWELVTAHEVAHQWFHGLIATHEVRWPMLDEGLTTWAHCDFLRHRHGLYRSAVSAGPLAVGCYEVLRAQTQNIQLLAPGEPANAFPSSRAYAASVYALTALALESVARTWGRERLLRALSLYAERYRLTHPEPDALFEVFDETYWTGFSSQVLVPILMQGERGAIHSVHIENTPSSSRARALREPGPSIPLSVRLTDVDGRVWRETWAGSSREFSYSSPTVLVSIEVDPDGAYMLDPQRLDNGAVAADHDSPQTPLLARFVAIFFSLLSSVFV